MREIKFRVWDVERGRHRRGCDNLMMDLRGTLYWQFGLDFPMPLDPVQRKGFIVEQYTGLKDANGVEIYEGDICVWKVNGELTGEVFFTHGAFDMRNQKIGLICWDSLRGMTTIIGNIHENPELLNETK